MPRDGTIPNKPPAPEAPKPPSREEIVLNQRTQLAAQWLDAEADRAVLQNELAMANLRIAQLEKQLAAVEPS